MLNLMRYMASHIKLLAICALVVCGCAGKPDVPGNDVDASEKVLSDKYEFRASEAGAELSAEEQGFVGDLNSFSFSLAKKVEESKSSESYVFSPVSVSYVLGMLANGAAGRTRDEILGVLGPDFKDVTAFNVFCRDLIVLSSKRAGEGETLELANFVLADNDFPILESYAETVKSYYDAAVANMGFTNTGKVQQYVNDIVSDKTHGNIKNVLNAEDLSSAACILFNTLYFKADWAKQFPAELTSKADFTGESGAKRKEDMMSNKFYGGVGYAEADGYQILTMPFGKKDVAGNYLCSFILPGEGKTIVDAISMMSRTKWTPSPSKPDGVDAVHVKIPKFKVSLSERFNEILKDLGMTSAFDDGANFSNLSSVTTAVSLFRHASTLSIDEAGAEASAVSVAVLDEGSSGSGSSEVIKYFHAEHPFLIVITEKTSGAILFMGCYR